MKKPTYVNAMLMLLLTLSLCISAASAVGTGIVYVTNNTGVQQGETATASIWLSNNFNPKAGSFTFAVYFNESVVNATDVSVAEGFSPPPGRSSGMKFAGATGSGYPNSTVPFWVANVTFRALTNDGSSTPVGIALKTLEDGNGDDLIPSTTVQNGTFSTEDVVLPVIDITTKSPVSSTFTIAGTIYCRRDGWWAEQGSGHPEECDPSSGRV